MWLGVPEEVDECLGNPEEGKNGKKCVRRPRGSRGKIRNSPPMPMMNVFWSEFGMFDRRSEFGTEPQHNSSLREIDYLCDGTFFLLLLIW
jgi:hypothetical protein